MPNFSRKEEKTPMTKFDNFSLKSEKGIGTVVELVKKVGSETLCAEGIDAANQEKERLNA